MTALLALPSSGTVVTAIFSPQRPSASTTIPSIRDDLAPGDMRTANVTPSSVRETGLFRLSGVMLMDQPSSSDRWRFESTI